MSHGPESGRSSPGRPDSERMPGIGRQPDDPQASDPGCVSCPTCRSWPPDCSFDRATSLGPFDGPLRDAVLALKFKGNKRIGRLLGAWIADVTMPVLDALIAVPLHPTRQRERGYNQAHLIARGLQAQLKVGSSTGADAMVISDGLRRVRATAQQALAEDADARAANLSGAFAASATRLNAIPPNGVIGLVDDVLTTGATLDACGRAILAVRSDLDLVAVIGAISVRESSPNGLV